MLLPSVHLPAKTMLQDPFTGNAVVEPFTVHALSLTEAYAEKTRAALTRREPAIRDFFDIDAALRKGLIKHGAPDFLHLVSRKLEVTADPVNVSSQRIGALNRQLEAQLKPVLRPADYADFALDRVVALLREILSGCGRT